MSRLGDARAQILEALRAGGVRTGTTARYSAPAVILEPGDPWSTPARMPGRDSRWQLTAIAGSADSDAAYAELAELVDRVDAALRTIDGCGWPTWNKPRDATGDVQYPSAIGLFTMAVA